MNEEELTPEWYNNRPVPEKMLRDLGRLPIISEALMPPNGKSAYTVWKRREDAPSLTKREQQILALLSHGMSNKMVAETLGIGYHTVRQHTKNARYVLRAKNTVHAIAIGIREGIIE